MNRKTIYRLILAAIAAVIFTASAFAQSRTNQIYRPCPGSTTPASVRVAVDGSITLTPCASKAVNFTQSGAATSRFSGGALDYIQVSGSVGVTTIGSTTSTHFSHNGSTVLEIGGLGTPIMNRTVTAGGTTGAQVINKPVGTVNFAAAATSIVVTNSQVSTTSIIFPVIRTADATCTFVKSVVPGSGTFTITLNAACTAETSVGFMVTN